MLNIIEKNQKKLAILVLKGDPLGEPDADLIRQKVREVVESHIQHIVFDLRDVKHINSAGLGGLVSAMLTMAKVGGTVQFAGVQQLVARSFEITKLSLVLDIVPSVEKAVAIWEEKVTR